MGVLIAFISFYQASSLAALTFCLSSGTLFVGQYRQSLALVLDCCTGSVGVCDHRAPLGLPTHTCLEVQELVLPLGISNALVISWLYRSPRKCLSIFNMISKGLCYLYVSVPGRMLISSFTHSVVKVAHFSMESLDYSYKAHVGVKGSTWHSECLIKSVSMG